jgi:hypothetical protein
MKVVNVDKFMDFLSLFSGIAFFILSFVMISEHR